MRFRIKGFEIICAVCSSRALSGGDYESEFRVFTQPLIAAHPVV